MDQSTEKTMGMLCHLLAFCGLSGIPLANVLGPLVMWLMKRDESGFVDACGKESLNFQISMFIYLVICGFLTIIVIGLFGMVIWFIVWVVCIIKACLAANQGYVYQYPLTIRFFS